MLITIRQRILPLFFFLISSPSCSSKGRHAFLGRRGRLPFLAGVVGCLFGRSGSMPFFARFFGILAILRVCVRVAVVEFLWSFTVLTDPGQNGHTPKWPHPKWTQNFWLPKRPQPKWPHCIGQNGHIGRIGNQSKRPHSKRATTRMATLSGPFWSVAVLTGSRPNQGWESTHLVTPVPPGWCLLHYIA